MAEHYSAEGPSAERRARCYVLEHPLCVVDRGELEIAFGVAVGVMVRRRRRSSVSVKVIVPVPSACSPIGHEVLDRSRRAV
jgi:hypothetical protein